MKEHRRVRPNRLPKAVLELPGKWVAVLDDEVVEARNTPEELIMALHERDIRGATILRSPAETDIELVCLG